MRGIFQILTILIFVIIWIRILEHKTLFAPARAITFTPKDYGLSFEDVYFQSADGTLINAWLIKAPEAQSTLIFSHGNAGNISDRLEKINLFRLMGVNVFIFDYRGYGRSKGFPSEKGLYQDAQGAYDYLMTRQDVNPDKIIVYGASLGGAVAVDLAHRRKIAALIVDSSFSSGADMARLIFPIVPAFLIHTKLDSMRKIAKVRAPKLFIHSQDDEIVPFALGKKLYEAAPSPKKFLPIAGDHNEGYLFSDKIFSQGIAQFLKDQHLI